MLPAKPQILFLDDGELVEARRVARAIGAEIVERCGFDWERGGDPAQDLVVVVASEAHLSDLEALPEGVADQRIAVLGEASRKERAQVAQARCHFVVYRPVHPEALRLLLIHCVYRGPERRKTRVSVGATIRYRCGFQRGRALLADLSEQGCRLLADERVEAGQRLLLFLPHAREAHREFFVRGEVVRVISGQRGSPNQVAVRFYWRSTSVRRRIETLIEAHLKGPAVMGPVPGDEKALPAEVLKEEERRREPRHAFERRVVALDRTATRVLVGRDLSVGGMRVDRHPSLGANQTFRLSIHIREGELPFVVRAKVGRDDGAAGVLLHFDAPNLAVQEQLRKALRDLPILEGEPGALPEGVILSEIVEIEYEEAERIATPA